MTPRTWKCVAGLCLLNFGVFWSVALYLGGDAVNGQMGGGRYFLANHGRLTEVSAGVFGYSRLHVMSLFVTHPLAFFAAWRATKAERMSRKGGAA